MVLWLTAREALDLVIRKGFEANATFSVESEYVSPDVIPFAPMLVDVACIILSGPTPSSIRIARTAVQLDRQHCEFEARVKTHTTAGTQNWLRADRAVACSAEKTTGARLRLAAGCGVDGARPFYRVVQLFGWPGLFIGGVISREINDFRWSTAMAAGQVDKHATARPKTLSRKSSPVTVDSTTESVHIEDSSMVVL